MNLAPPSLALQIVEIGELPLYNPDMEEAPPQAWLGLRERIKRADAALFVTPEYNRSVPAALKNALDVGRVLVRLTLPLVRLPRTLGIMRRRLH